MIIAGLEHSIIKIEEWAKQHIAPKDRWPGTELVGTFCGVEFRVVKEENWPKDVPKDRMFLINAQALENKGPGRPADNSG